MQILAKCPQCGHVLKLSISAADRRLRCVSCGRMFKVPPLGRLNKALDVIKDATSSVYVDEEGNMYG